MPRRSAGETSTCATARRRRSACRSHIENSGTRVRARAVVDDARRHVGLGRRLRVRQRLGRRSASASSCAASCCAAATTWRASSDTCRLTMDGPRCSCGATGLLGSVRVEPRDAGPLLRTTGGVGRAGCRRRAGVHDRGPDLARPARRRESARRDPGDRPVSRRRAGVGRQRLRPDAGLRRRRDHRRRGT